MTSRDFCYWLQGLFELGDPTALDANQTDLVKRHLAMVFLHEIDPSAGGPGEQETLNKIHHGIKDVAAEMNKTQPPRIGGPDGPGGIKYRC